MLFGNNLPRFHHVRMYNCFRTDNVPSCSSNRFSFHSSLECVLLWQPKVFARIYFLWYSNDFRKIEDKGKRRHIHTQTLKIIIAFQRLLLLEHHSMNTYHFHMRFQARYLSIFSIFIRIIEYVPCCRSLTLSRQQQRSTRQSNWFASSLLISVYKQIWEKLFFVCCHKWMRGKNQFIRFLRRYIVFIVFRWMCRGIFIRTWSVCRN